MRKIGVASVGIGEAAADAEVVLALAVAVEALEREVDAVPGIGQRGPELMVLERAVRRLEDRRSGLLRGGRRGRTGEQGEHQDPTT